MNSSFLLYLFKPFIIPDLLPTWTLCHGAAVAACLCFLCSAFPPLLPPSPAPSAAVSQFRVCILRRPPLKANYLTMPPEGCPNPKTPPNAAHKCSFFSPSFWRMHSYYPSWPHISQDYLRVWKRRKKERKWRHRMV